MRRTHHRLIQRDRSIYINRAFHLTLIILTFIASQVAGLFAIPEQAQAAASSDPAEEIVYIDDVGIIRVIDTQPATPDSPAVLWSSPGGGWTDLDLGDVNGDTDMEIIAYSKDIDNNTLITIYDPVVASGFSPPGQEINGIPWDMLYTETIPGRPELIMAGDFDTGIPGDEFLLVHLSLTGLYRTVIFNAAALEPNGFPSGRLWKVHLEKEFDYPWTYGASGDLVESEAEDLVMIDSRSTESKLDLLQADNDLFRWDGKPTDSDNWQKVAIGQIIEGGREEVAVTKSTKPDKDSLIVYRIDGDNEFSTEEDWIFTPQPEHVFLADISGNGDKEVFIIRNYSGEGERLISRDDWGDDKDRGDIELELDSDNGYELGDGGDTDGDGIDEVVLLRDNNIRVYRDTHRSFDDNTITNYGVNTNKDTLKIGNLDAVGFVQGPQFGVDKAMIEISTPTGTTSDIQTLQVTNISTADVVDVIVDRSNLNRVNVTPAFSQTPATLNVTFDARGVAVGDYEETILLDSTADVLNKPFAVKVVIHVTPAVMSVTPSSAGLNYFPCPVETNPPEEKSLSLLVDGTAGLHYRAVLFEAPSVQAAEGQTGGFTGGVAGGEIDQDGNVILYDHFGNSEKIEMPNLEAAEAGVANVSWPIDPDLSWAAELTSPDETAPSRLTLKMMPILNAQNEFPSQTAQLVVLAYTDQGEPSGTIQTVPITVICAKEKLSLPILNVPGLVQ